MRATPTRETLDRVPVEGVRADAVQTERQLELARRYAYYATKQYSHRGVDWDGRPRPGATEREGIARKGFVPTGYVDTQRTLEQLPQKFRHPTAPYHLVHSVVGRFTSLLFGARSHPTVECQDDWATSDYIQGLIEVTRWWSRWALARDYGGATGSACVSFAFIAGKPVLEVHDPRFTTPTFTDPRTRELDAIEIKYVFQRMEVQRDGSVRPTAYLYRRIINRQRDVTFLPVRCDNDREPWVEDETKSSTHNLGECPAVWVQNDAVVGEVDGTQDCLGIEDTSEEIDALISQSSMGVKANCDPSLVIKTELELGAIQKGSKTAIKVKPNDSVEHLEMTGSGAIAAREQVSMLRRQALEVVRCVIDNPDAAEATATEAERRYQAMYDRGDEFREQYAEEGIKPLLAKMLRAIRLLAGGTMSVDPVTGLRTPQVVEVPPRIETEPSADGAPPVIRVFPRQVGNGTLLDVQWPPWNKPTATEAGAAASAVGAAVAAKVLDRSTAITYLAPQFGGVDPNEIERRVEAEGQAVMEAESQALLVGLNAGAPTAAAPSADLTMDDVKADLVTLNEYRASKGLGPMPDGEIRWSQRPGAGATQDSAMNGAQVTSLLEVVAQVSSGAIPREAGIVIITSAFPISIEAASAMLPTVIHPPPAPAVPPGAGAVPGTPPPGGAPESSPPRSPGVP